MTFERAIKNLTDNTCDAETAIELVRMINERLLQQSDSSIQQRHKILLVALMAIVSQDIDRLCGKCKGGIYQTLEDFIHVFGAFDVLETPVQACSRKTHDVKPMAQA